MRFLNLHDYINEGGGINPGVTPWGLFSEKEYSLAGKLWLVHLEPRGWKIRTAGALIGFAVWAVCCYKSWSLLNNKTVVEYLATTPAVALFLAGEMPIIFVSKLAKSYLGPWFGGVAFSIATAGWAYCCHGGEKSITATAQKALASKAKDVGLVATSPSVLSPQGGQEGSNYSWITALLVIAILGGVGYVFRN